MFYREELEPLNVYTFLVVFRLSLATPGTVHGSQHSSAGSIAGFQCVIGFNWLIHILLAAKVVSQMVATV
jgi:hypothetical protein